jgi:hypothetical protein
VALGELALGELALGELALGEIPKYRNFSDLIGRGYFKLFPRMFERKCIKKTWPVVGCQTRCRFYF